jgi:hypothetical protein
MFVSVLPDQVTGLTSFDQQAVSYGPLHYLLSHETVNVKGPYIYYYTM